MNLLIYIGDCDEPVNQISLAKEFGGEWNLVFKDKPVEINVQSYFFYGDVSCGESLFTICKIQHLC